jgi:Biotin protein ligase C terminal domain.
VGREVRVELPGGRHLTGLATGIDHAGHLLVRGVVDGREGEHSLSAGEVVHVRPAG